MRVHRPVAPKSLAFAIVDEARARRLLGVGRDGVFEIAEHDVDLRDQFRHLGAHLLDVRRHEMDHALELDRQFPQRRRRADRERLEEIARQFHPDVLGLAVQSPPDDHGMSGAGLRQATFAGNGRCD